MMNPMATAPKDGTRILLHAPADTARCGIAGWIEGVWFRDKVYPNGCWNIVWLDYHGCGCCGSTEPEFDGWLPLPGGG